MGEQVVAGLNGGIAQLGEHLPCKQGVKGSNPFISTKQRKLLIDLFLENRIPNNIKIFCENRKILRR